MNRLARKRSLPLVSVFFCACVLCGSLYAPLASASSRQANVISQQCPTGGKEAEELFQLGRKYRAGHGGFPVDKAKAEELFEQALWRGNAKAALVIGQMYRIDYGSRPYEAKRDNYSIAMYKQAMKMGCPEGYQLLAECYEKGWGVRADKAKAIELLKQAAEMGSPKAMEFYGTYLLRSLYEVEAGRQWLERSMALGNGDAGDPLADSYDYPYDANIEGIVTSLRRGAALGSKECIFLLKMLYENGWYGQDEDPAYAERLEQLWDSIDDFDRPQPIPDFDKRFPPKPYRPYQDRWGKNRGKIEPAGAKAEPPLGVGVFLRLRAMRQPLCSPGQRFKQASQCNLPAMPDGR